MSKKKKNCNGFQKPWRTIAQCEESQAQNERWLKTFAQHCKFSLDRAIKPTKHCLSKRDWGLSNSFKGWDRREAIMTVGI